MSCAVYHVEDGGEIIIQGEYAYGETGALGVKGKSITVSGDTLNLSATTSFDIKGPVTLSNVSMKVSDSGSIYANGNHFTIAESVEFDSRLGHIYGGGNTVSVDSTHMELSAGIYREIYGGGFQAEVTGNTELLVGGNVNKGIDVFANDHEEALNYCVYGGSYSHGVGGNTSIVFDGKNAVAGYIYAGGYGKYASVSGTSKITMHNGTVYSIYGGSRSATEYADRITSTEVLMDGGTVGQIFGGSDGANLTGSTSVEIKGGTVTRRIYGGCYNDWVLTWKSDYHVVGNTTVILHDEATYGTSETDNAICATSRRKTNTATDDEVATLKIETENLYNQLEERLTVMQTGTQGYDELIYPYT